MEKTLDLLELEVRRIEKRIEDQNKAIASSETNLNTARDWLEGYIAYRDELIEVVGILTNQDGERSDNRNFGS